MMRAHFPAFLLCIATIFATAAEAGERLDSIRHKGVLTCGVGADVPGFSQRRADGQWVGFDVDICNAIGGAIFGRQGKVEFRAINSLETFLRDPGIDIVLRGLTWTSSRELGPAHLRFGPIILYDGQAFLVPRKLSVSAPDQLSGRRICVSADAGFVGGLRSYFREHALTLKAVIKDRRVQAEQALFAGECDAMSADATELAEALIGRARQPQDYMILPQQISKEPLAPLLRSGDEEFFDAVRWAIFALIDAEELGITSSNLQVMHSRDDPDGHAFFTSAQTGGAAVAQGWAAAAVAAARGNYGEVFERNFGSQSRAHMPRGLSRTWTKGGLMYAPPVR